MATPVSPNLSRVSADSQHNDNNTSSGEMVRFDTNCTMLRVTNISIVIHSSKLYTQGTFWAEKVSTFLSQG